MIKNNDKVGYENKEDFRGVVLEYVLKMFADKAMIELIRLPSKKRVDKIAVAITLDNESEKIIRILIKGNAKKLKEFQPIHKNIIKPLCLFLDKEVLLYAKLKRLKFKKEKKKKSEFEFFLNELEEKHPEVKRAVVRGFLEGN